MEKKCPQCLMMVPQESKICPCCGYSDKTFKKMFIKSIRKYPLTFVAMLIITFLCVWFASDLIIKMQHGKGKNVQYLINSEAKEILLKRITMVHSEWRLINEKEIDGGQILIAAQNPTNKIKPIWLIKNGAVHSINGAAKMLTDDFPFSYDINPLEAIDIMEGRKVYKKLDSKRKTWNSIQEGMDVLKAHAFITEQEAVIIDKLDEYLDNPSNSDSKKAIENWANQHNITPERIIDILTMRLGYSSIEDIEKAGFVRVGEKKIIKEVGQPTGKPIKKFDVSYQKTASAVLIQVQTDLPDGAPLMISISKTGLADDDIWIGNQSKTIVKHSKAEVIIPLITHKGSTLREGFYDIEIIFNSYWSTSNKDINPNIKAIVGEFGENLKTEFTGEYERQGKKYRTINFEKIAAFRVPE